MNTSDAIAISAAIVGAALSLFALAIAVAAIWGIGGLRAAAKIAAEEEARKQVVSMISPDSEVGKRLRQEVERRIALVADQVYADMSFSTAFSQAVDKEQSGQSSTIAEEYPKEG